MRSSVPLLISGALVTSVLGLAAPAAAAPPADNPGAEHRRIVDYWTAERVAGAQPADRVVGPKGREVNKGKPGGGGGKPDKPGGGGDGGSGGDGGGTSIVTVTGAPWTKGGDVLSSSGRVLFTLASGNYTCSASLVEDGVVGRSVAVTAGHCLYDERAGAFAENWMFVPEFDSAPTFSCDSTRWGCWTATALVTTSSWATGDFNGDVGFAVLGAGGKTSQSLHADVSVGSQPIDFGERESAQVYAFGYPAEKKYSGADLVYCAGEDFADPYLAGSTAYGLDCAMNGGSSGGPWFRGFNEETGSGTVTSVNSFGYTGVRNKMFGPTLGDEASSAFQTAKSTTKNALVS